MNEVLDKYVQEISEELKITPFNIKDVQMRLPARKHFWVARLINTKRELNKLKEEKKKKEFSMFNDVMDTAHVRITATAARAKVSNSKPITELETKINELELLVEYLEKVEKIMGNAHWEIKNMIELQQMEMQ